MQTVADRPSASTSSPTAGWASSPSSPPSPRAPATPAERLASQPTRLAELSSQPTTTDRLAGGDAPSDRTTIQGLGTIPSYSGDLPSPLQAMWYAPETSEVFKGFYPDSEIRGWVKDAAAYNDVPHELMAAVLQQENAPGASTFHQVLQFGERSVTTFAAILDQLPGSPVPDAIAGGSSGIANMKRETLQSAAEYIENTYDRPALPDDVRYRIGGWDQDTRLPGDDLKSDLYYASGVLRQLIDREMGAGYQGPLSLAQTERIIASYNGSGPLAEKYGRDAMNLLQGAADGSRTLYFYEK
ncbi:MAG TPA: hypothetical protein VLA16_16920 [Ideonella sp.]|nr:hypothetical protein [Ideonella sp.]